MNYPVVRLWFVDSGGQFVGDRPPEDLAAALEPHIDAILKGARNQDADFSLIVPQDSAPAWHFDVSARPVPQPSPAQFAISVGMRSSVDAYHLERFDLALEATQDAVWEWVVASGDVWWNERCNEIFGYPPGSASSFAGWTDRIHPDERENVLEHYMAICRSSERIWEDSYRVVRTDGKILEVRDRGIIERDSRGNALRLVGVMSDMTEIRSAERTRDEAVHRFAEIAATIEDAIWLLDTRTLDVLFNSQSFDRIFGRPADSLTSLRDFLDFVHPEDVEQVKAEMDRVLNRGLQSLDVSYRIERPDGEIRWIRTRGRPVQAKNGTVVRIAGVSSDVTAQRKLEQDLLQSRKLESVGRLAGGVAHDFNNLLTVILSASEFALQSLPAKSHERDDIEDVVDAATRAATLTNQLLSFARRQVIRPEPINLNHLTESMDKLLRRVIGEHVRLNTVLAPDLGHVFADRGQIEQVLVNLAVNARDAMPEGGTLTLETGNVVLDRGYADSHPDVEPGEYVMIAVTDTGPGIPSKLRDRIFEPFFTTKSDGKGTGLGLASCYGIIRQAGGQILLYSEVGRGSTFKILLPLTNITSEEAKPERAIEGPVSGLGITILFVEDDEHVRRIGERALTQHGYEVLVAANGVEALELLERRPAPLRLVITDVVMPRMGGMELARRLAEVVPDARVLFTSGYTQNSIVHQGVLDESVNFLAKPYTTRQLVTCVGQLLEE